MATSRVCMTSTLVSPYSRAGCATRAEWVGCTGPKVTCWFLDKRSPGQGPGARAPRSMGSVAARAQCRAEDVLVEAKRSGAAERQREPGQRVGQVAPQKVGMDA